MIMNGFGLGEFLVSFIVLVLSLGLPLAIVILLYKIYDKLKSIEEHLKKK